MPRVRERALTPSVRSIILSALTRRAVVVCSGVKDGKVSKRCRAASPPVSPVAGRGAERAAACKTFEEKEQARMQYNRQSATLSAARRTSKLSDLLSEQANLEAAYQARLAQVALLERIITGARWATVELPPVEV